MLIQTGKVDIAGTRIGVLTHGDMLKMLCGWKAHLEEHPEKTEEKEVFTRISLQLLDAVPVSLHPTILAHLGLPATSWRAQ